MEESAGQSHAAVGFTVKSGWAAAVLLAGPPASLRLADSRRIDLSDPAIPESRQPYHAGFGTGRGGGPELEHLLRSVRRFGKQSVSDLIRHYRMSGHKLSGVGVVAGSLIDPERIANEHVRIHALEGRLFRSVVEEAALRSALPFSIWRERELYAAAAEVLRQPERHVRSTVSALGEVVAGPWRVEQKAAAVAAWLVLAGPGESAQSTKGEVGGLPVIRRRRRS